MVEINFTETFLILLLEDPFIIKDVDAETKFNFSLEESIERSKTSKLLQGMEFYITKSCKPPLDDMKELIKIAGGKVQAKKKKYCAAGLQYFLLAFKYPTKSKKRQCSYCLV